MARILIIDPDPTAAKLLEEFVVELGHQVAGPEDMASGLGPDLVLLDPADNGAIASAAALREQSERLPIVCVSTHHPSEEVDALRPSAVLMKPFRGRLLEWAITEALLAQPVLAAA